MTRHDEPAEGDVAGVAETWGHWCHEQEPTSLPVTASRCPQCGALNLDDALDPR